MSQERLTLKFLIVVFLSIIAFLAFTNYFSIRYFKIREAKDSTLVDASGRNRMLSQKIAFHAEMLVAGKPAEGPLTKAIDLHDQSLLALKNGGIAPGIANDQELPAAPESVLADLQAAEELWKKYRVHSLAILALHKGSKAEEKKRVKEAIAFIEANSDEMLARNNALVKAYVKNNIRKQDQVHLLLILLLTLDLLAVTGAWFLVRQYVLLPIKNIAEASEEISKGNFDNQLEAHNDPNVQRITTSINLLGGQLDQSAKFAEKIGNGDFDFEVEAHHESRLFSELMSMRSKLILVAEEDQKRNWTTEGLANFAELLRNNQDDLTDWSQQIISQLVQYLGANQGGLFSLMEPDGEQPYLELSACYAWERNKFMNKQIEPGEGLVGQCWLEKESIYMTELPEEYVSIRSGLGRSTPSALLIVPLVINEQIMGVIELAGFQKFEAHQIAFVEKLGEDIAATLSSIRTNQQTKNLLEQSQVQTEAMRAQEEEIRQNMEEIQATQEEMDRKQREIQGKMEMMDSSMIHFEFSPEGKIIAANDRMLQFTACTKSEIMNQPIQRFVAEGEAKLLNGEVTSNYSLKNNKGNELGFVLKHTKIKDMDGQLRKTVVVGMEIPSEVMASTMAES